MVSDGYTLGHAGGARGVDHIRQAVCRGLCFQRLGTEVLQPLPALLQAHARQAVRNWQARHGRCVRQQHADATVLNQISQPILRIVRVQGHIGRTGLVDGNQGYSQRKPSFGSNTH
ncbi:hypothetical protein D3C81_681640 [compost metagenome]